MRKMTSDFVLGVNTAFLEKPENFRLWYEKMPSYRKEKIDTIRPLNSKNLSLGAGIVLLNGLSQWGISFDEISFAENGKPFIKGADGNRFNLSHSGTLAVGAFSDAAVGIDVEKIKTFGTRLVNFVYNENEITYIKNRSNSEEEENTLYTRLWPMQESVMKYYGQGLSMDPRKLYIDQEHDNQVFFEGMNLPDIYFTGYEYEGHCITVCSGKKSFSDEIEFVQI